MTQVLSQVSTVEIISHNTEMEEAQFLPLRYFFLKAFFNPLLRKTTHMFSINYNLTCSCEYFS